ncbi:hypothetical protein [Streptomyces sp. NPDC001719]
MYKNPNIRLHRLIEEAGWSQAQLGAAVTAVAAERGLPLRCDRSSVSRWLSGTTPRPPAPIVLLEALSRRLGRPVTVYEAGLTSAPAHAAASDLSWEADPLRKLTVLARALTDPGRRHLLTAGVFTLAALAVPDTAALARAKPTARPALLPGPCHIGKTDHAGRAEIEHTQTMARLFAQAAEAHGARHVQPALAEYLNLSVAPWLHAPATDTIRGQLVTSAAQLTTLLGLMSTDAGMDAHAQHCYRTAAHLAAQADDQAAFAIALRAMSAHAHDLGHHTRGVHHLADRAAEAARHAPLAVRAYTLAHLAVIQAHNNRRAAANTLATAERLYDKAHAAPGPFTAYPHGALHYQRAQTLATLGDRHEATLAFATSLRLRTPAERLATTLTEARLAETLLAQGHLEAALPHWHAFLATYPLLHSTRTARRLDAMRRLLRPHSRHHATAKLLAQAATLGI